MSCGANPIATRIRFPGGTADTAARAADDPFINRVVPYNPFIKANMCGACKVILTNQSNPAPRKLWLSVALIRPSDS